MFRTLLLVGHLLAVSFGEGTLNVPLNLQHLQYTGHVVPPAVKAASYGSYVAGRTYGSVDGGRAAILERQALRTGQYIANPGFSSAARYQAAAVSRVSPAGIYANRGALYNPGFYQGLYGPRVGSYYGRSHLGVAAVPSYDAGLPIRPIPVSEPRPPIARPVVPPQQTAIPDVQQIVKRPIPRPDPAGGFYAGRVPFPGSYSHIYGGSYAHPFSYGRSTFGGYSPFYGRGAHIAGIRGTSPAYPRPHPEDPFGLYGNQGLAEITRRREEERKRALRQQDARLAYAPGRTPISPIAAPRVRSTPIVNPYARGDSPFSFYGHSYNLGAFGPYSHYDPRFYGGIDSGFRAPVRPRPAARYGLGGIARSRPIDYRPAPHSLPYGAVHGQYQTYFDRSHLLNPYRPSSIVSPYSYDAAHRFTGINYGHPGLLGYGAHGYIPGGVRTPVGIRRPGAYVPPPPTQQRVVRPDQVKRPEVPPVVPPPAGRLPRPEIPPAPEGQKVVVGQDPIKRPPVLAGGLAGIVARAEYYQPRRLPDESLSGRYVPPIYRGRPYVQPRRLPESGGFYASRYGANYGILNPGVSSYAGVVTHRDIVRPDIASLHHGLPVAVADARAAHHLHTPYAPYSYADIYGHTKVLDPVIHHNPLFPKITPETAAVQKSIHS